VALILFLCLAAPTPTFSVLLYKNYIVHDDRGIDILCDPYVVRKHDSITKLFQQRGEMAEKDWPEFLEIFKRLNPHIPDVNLIEPEEHIYIPLKKLKKDTLIGQDTGVVTIPFVTVSNLHEFIKNYSKTYTVRENDWISKLVSREYGTYGTRAYEEGIELFKLLNPQISDLDRIFPGQPLWIPEPSLKTKPWYTSLFDSSGRITEITPPAKEEPLPPPPEKDGTVEETQPSPIQKVADILDGDLQERGIYYFPREGSTDLQIDLSQTPVIKMNNGTRIMFAKENQKPEDLQTVEAYWKNTKLVSFNPNNSLTSILDSTINAVEQKPKKQIVFTDKGLKVDVQANWIITRPSMDDDSKRYICVNVIQKHEERTPEMLLVYLEKQGVIVEDILQEKSSLSAPSNRPRENKKSSEDVISIGLSNYKTFVKNVLMAMGTRYYENAKITFPYVGIQVEATANLISTRDGHQCVVDFGELYGDAVDAIERTGRIVVQIKEKDSLNEIVKKLLDGLGEMYTRDPTFFASKRPQEFNTAITIPGYLVEKTGYPNTLLAAVPLNNKVVEFLKGKGVNVIMIQSDKDSHTVG